MVQDDRRPYRIRTDVSPTAKRVYSNRQTTRWLGAEVLPGFTPSVRCDRPSTRRYRIGTTLNAIASDPPIRESKDAPHRPWIQLQVCHQHFRRLYQALIHTSDLSRTYPINSDHSVPRTSSAIFTTAYVRVRAFTRTLSSYCLSQNVTRK